MNNHDRKEIHVMFAEDCVVRDDLYEITEQFNEFLQVDLTDILNADKQSEDFTIVPYISAYTPYEIKNKIVGSTWPIYRDKNGIKEEEFDKAPPEAKRTIIRRIRKFIEYLLYELWHLEVFPIDEELYDSILADQIISPIVSAIQYYSGLRSVSNGFTGSNLYILTNNPKNYRQFKNKSHKIMIKTPREFYLDLKGPGITRL